MDEVDLDAVDLGSELRERVEPLLEPADVVVGDPVAREFLDGRELDALRPIIDELLAWPAVASMRRRKSSICSSGISTWKDGCRWRSRRRCS
jgi:hypothetical protein